MNFRGKSAALSRRQRSWEIFVRFGFWWNIKIFSKIRIPRKIQILTQILIPRRLITILVYRLILKTIIPGIITILPILPLSKLLTIIQRIIILIIRSLIITLMIIFLISMLILALITLLFRTQLRWRNENNKIPKRRDLYWNENERKFFSWLPKEVISFFRKEKGRHFSEFLEILFAFCWNSDFFVFFPEHFSPLHFLGRFSPLNSASFFSSFFLFQEMQQLSKNCSRRVIKFLFKIKRVRKKKVRKEKTKKFLKDKEKKTTKN